MLSELLRKEYKVKTHYLELENAKYEELSDTLRDRFIDDKVGEITVTYLKFRTKNTTEEEIVRVLKDFDYLVFFENVEDSCISVVYFDGEYTNELITKHNEKVLSVIKKLDKANKELAIRYEQALTKDKAKKIPIFNMPVHSQIPIPMPNLYLLTLERLLNGLLSKSDYVYGGFTKERTNLVLLDDPAFKGEAWTLAMKKELMCSLFLDLPIGTFHLNKFDDYYLLANKEEKKELEQYDSVIYDGKQRLAAILSFLRGEFSVFFNGLEYTVDNMHGLSLVMLLHRKVLIYETRLEKREELLTRFNLLHGITD